MTHDAPSKELQGPFCGPALVSLSQEGKLGQAWVWLVPGIRCCALYLSIHSHLFLMFQTMHLGGAQAPWVSPGSVLQAVIHRTYLGPSRQPHAIFGSKSVTRIPFWGHSKVMQKLYVGVEKILTPLWLLQWVGSGTMTEGPHLVHLCSAACQGKI